MSTAETIAFRAETKELLDLVIHSLYTHKEIFLRELISNASDALDKLRFEVLTAGEGAGDDLSEAAVEALRVRLVIDAERRVLHIRDTGIGMSREEVIENLGTIARSGTKGFLDALRKAEDSSKAIPELIGQFGVGFYSAFMVADEVEVETRRAGEAKGVGWRSRGDGEYEIEDIDKDEIGTTVSLHLKPLDPSEEGNLDFTDEGVIQGIVKRYSDFIEYPVEMELGEGEERKLTVLNSQKPLWTRPRSEIEDEEYAEFYKHLTHDWHEPLETIHFQVEGTLEYSALLYLPKQRPMDLFDPDQAKSRIHLYVRRVFIMADCEELAPVWLRFVRGVVDSGDLPLNISRETLQHNRQMGKIQSKLTNKVLETMKRLQEERREDFGEFWKAFGPVLKEGLYYDDAHREELAGLALFESTAGDEPRSLGEYVQDMPAKQKEIYVLLAPDLETARRSPHLEAVASREFEVLFLTDPVDEFVLQRLSEFEGKKIRRIDQGEVDLEDEQEKEARQQKEKDLEPLVEAVKKELAESVEDVRFSNRLTDSPACLVASEHELTPQMRRMMEASGQSAPPSKRILELNAEHPLVGRMQSLSGDEASHERFAQSCELVLGMAQVAEGAAPSDPQRFTQLVSELMLGAS